jgi:hypothetical protein
MRRALLLSLSLITIGRIAAVAQSCGGLGSFSNSPLQLTGEGSLTGTSTAVGAGIAYGFRAGPFGRVGIGTRSRETFGGSSLDLSAGAGYEISLGKTAQYHLCPVGSLGLEIGPRNTFGSEVDRSSRSALLGLAFGATVGMTRRWEVVPSVGLSYAYRKDQAQDGAGTVLFQISDHYALAQFGLGLILHSNFSIRPHFDLPLGLEGGDPTVGVTLGYNFGRHRAADRGH